ncbi:uncharacterized protein LOC130775145 [Actinidia eriantha]|uniref:uncharacterized protein LOC130775145 n=1 Tax=Actinidia eriantha TaxID=165200 RepID=UPI0025879504|nr:uncharacterized protein LOC130775145 [Actinidia eriantha]
MDRDIGDSDGGGGGEGEGHSNLPSDSPSGDPLSGGGGFRPMRGGEAGSDHQRRRLFGQKQVSRSDFGGCLGQGYENRAATRYLVCGGNLCFMLVLSSMKKTSKTFLKPVYV